MISIAINPFAQLVTKANQLVEKIEQLHSQRKINAFTLIRLRKEANDLLKVDAFYAYQILGMLASLEKNITHVRENYEKSLNLAKMAEDKAQVFINYARSLQSMGYLSEAAELGMKSYNIFPSSNLNTKQNIFHFMNAGLFHRAIELAHNVNVDVDVELSCLPQITQFMDKHGVSDNELQKLIEIAINVLHAYHFFDFHYQEVIAFRLVKDEYYQWFCYVIKINRSVEEVVEMIHELCEKLAEADLPIKLTSNFIISYEIAEE